MSRTHAFVVAESSSSAGVARSASHLRFQSQCALMWQYSVGEDLVPSVSPQFDPARIQPICALLLNPLLLHPHPTIALHVLPSPPLQIITTHRGSQEDSPLLCSCPQRFHQARLPRHPNPYRPGWYRSYRVRVGQRSSG